MFIILYEVGDTLKLYEILSLKVVNFISKKLPYKTEIELEEIKYGIEIFLVNLLKLPIILILAYILGIFKLTLITMISFSLIRTFAAGIHARKSITCLLSTLLIYFGIIYLAKFISIPLVLKFILFIFSSILLIKYAPADTEEKPYINKSSRKKLRFLSVIVALIMFIFSTFLKNKLIGNIIILSLFLESFLITPFIYKLLGRRYKNYEYY